VNVISTRQLSRNYGSRLGIDRVDLEVPQGEIFGFLGPNGAGKTTTIRILMGMMQPSSGEATIFGKNCWRESAVVKRDIGYLPGDVRLYPWLTAETALKISGQVRGQNVREFGRELCERLQLEPKLAARKMSRGTRQKLGIVLALAHRPQLLVLDEPTAALDPLMQDELANCLRELVADGSTVFFSSHTLNEVELLCKRVAVVRAGRIVAHETLDVLRRQAGRVVSLRFRDEATAANTPLPPFLKKLHQSNDSWQGELTGDAPEFLRWAADQALEEVSLGMPSLEGLFRRYYEDETHAHKEQFAHKVKPTDQDGEVEE